MSIPKYLFLLAFIAFSGLAGCTKDNPAARLQQDNGILLLDGGGPMGWDTTAPPPPKPDSGGGATTKAKFCNGLTVSGKTVTITMRIGSTTLSAQSKGCSPCQAVKVGSQTMQLVYNGQLIGQGTLDIQSNREYVFWLESAGGGKAKLSGGGLDPTSGKTCANYTPNL